MKKIVIGFVISLMVCTSYWSLAQQSSTKASGASGPAVRPKIMTLPGFVESVDLGSRLITIDGKQFRLHENVEISSKGESKGLDAISLGKFVIATIKEGSVVAITLVPQGQGF